MSVNFPGSFDGPERITDISRNEKLDAVDPDGSGGNTPEPAPKSVLPEPEAVESSERFSNQTLQVTDRFGNKAYYSRNGGLVLVTLENAASRQKDVGSSDSPFVIVLAAIPAFRAPKAATPPDTKSKEIKSPLQAEVPSELQQDKRGEGEDVTGMYQESERKKAFSFKTDNLLKTLALIDMDNHDGKVSQEELENYIQATGEKIIALKPRLAQSPNDDLIKEELTVLIAQRRRARMLRRYFDVIAAVDGESDSLSFEDIRKLASEDGNESRVSYEDIELYRHHFQNEESLLEEEPDDENQIDNQGLAQEVRNLMIEINLLGQLAGNETETSETEEVLTREELEHGLCYFQNLLGSMATYAAYPQYLAIMKTVERKILLTNLLLRNFDRLGQIQGETLGINFDDLDDLEPLEY